MFLKFAKRNKPYIESMVIICKEYNTSSPWHFGEVREVTDEQGYFLLKKYKGILERSEEVKPTKIAKKKKKAQSKPKQVKMVDAAKKNKQLETVDDLPW